MLSNITITLPKQEKERLSRLALRYGLSLGEFSRHILEELVSGIPEESIGGYDNPAEIKVSLRRAVKDWQGGRVSRKI